MIDKNVTRACIDTDANFVLYWFTTNIVYFLKLFEAQKKYFKLN